MSHVSIRSALLASTVPDGFPIGAPSAQAVRMTTADFNLDGRPDVVVAANSVDLFSRLAPRPSLVLRDGPPSQPARERRPRDSRCSKEWPMTSSTYAEMIDGHYAEAWRATAKAVRWTSAPVADLPNDFRVLVVPRSADTIAFATRCMSLPTDEERLELHVLCRPRDSEHTSLAEILTAVAHYHRTASRLAVGHSVNFGKPWAAGSNCVYGVISLPYLDGPRLEWLPEPRVRFLWLIPVTKAEIEFKKKRGMDALEERFEAAGFDYLDPLRPSIV